MRHHDLRKQWVRPRYNVNWLSWFFYFPVRFYICFGSLFLFRMFFPFWWFMSYERIVTPTKTWRPVAMATSPYKSLCLIEPFFPLGIFHFWPWRDRLNTLTPSFVSPMCQEFLNNLGSISRSLGNPNHPKIHTHTPNPHQVNLKLQKTSHRLFKESQKSGNTSNGAKCQVFNISRVTWNQRGN